MSYWLTEHEPVLLFAGDPMDLLLVIASDSNESKGVTDQLTLNDLVEGRRAAQGGKDVHFEEPWLQIFIY